MRVAVLQFAVGEYTKMLEVSRQRHLSGCQKFGYSYRCDFELRAKHPYWHKLEMVIEAVKDGFDYIVWLDADTVWNGQEPLTDALHVDGIGMAWTGGDWKPPFCPHYNCGVYFVRCCENRDAVLSDLYKWRDEPDNGHPWGDQHALHALLSRGEIKVVDVDNRFNHGVGQPTVRVWHGLGMQAVPEMVRYEKCLWLDRDKIGSRMLKYSDFSQDWFVDTVEKLGLPAWDHRKFWEYVYIAAVLHEHKKVHPGSKGIVFGAGKEWLPSYLAKQGCFVTVTDNVKGGLWASSNQYGSSKWDCFREDLVDRDTFDKMVTFEQVDMNCIPQSLKDASYDFAWSSGSLEHIGSRHAGRLFVWNSLGCLKKGGISVHTTEGELHGGSFDSDGFSVFCKSDFEHMVDVQWNYSARVYPVSWGTDIAGSMVGMYDFDAFRKWTSVGIVIEKT